MIQKEKMQSLGPVLFGLIIVLEVVIFWGQSIIYTVYPKAYFTEKNISRNLTAYANQNESEFVLNEMVTEIPDLKNLTVENMDVQTNECSIEAELVLKKSKYVDITYHFLIAYEKSGTSNWKITSLRSRVDSSPEDLTGTWEGSISQEEDFFHSAFSYRLYYEIDATDPENIYGIVRAVDRMGAEPEDTVNFTGVWNEESCTLNVLLERPITQNQFGAGALYYDPYDNCLKSNSVSYEKTE